MGHAAGEAAELANAGLSTLGDFESGKRTAIPNNVEAIRRALEAAGIEFLNEDGRRGIAAKDDAPAQAFRTGEA